MPIRDIVVAAVVFGSLPFCFAYPYVGVLVWSWLGFMNPHRLAWGFAHDMSFAQMVAVATLLGLVFTKDRRSIPPEREALLLAALWGLFALTTLFATYPDRAWEQLEKVSKILLMIFITIILFQDRVKLRYLLLVVALSIGFYGFKGGIFGLLTGGAYMMHGPEYSFIGDNNGFALGMNMTLPILFFLAREERRPWLRRLLYAIFSFSIVSVLLTYSRSGFLGLAVVLLALLSRAKAKVLAVPAGAAAAAALVWFLPERWFDRMYTILEYQQDVTALGRLNAWYVGWQLALDSPLIGGGFWAFSPEAWARYLPGTNQNSNAHSIYFHVLGEHGFTGLLLFLGLIVSTLFSLRKIRRNARDIPDATWIVNYSRMVEASLFGYLVTGAFQNLTYFDLFWLLIGITIILKRLMKELTSSSQPNTKPSVAKTGVASRGGVLGSWRPLP